MNYINIEEVENNIQKHDIVLVVFKTDWCGSCKMMENFLDELSKDFLINIINPELVKDWNHKQMEEWNIRVVPTIFLFKGGKKIFRHEGFLSKNSIIDLIKKNK